MRVLIPFLLSALPLPLFALTVTSPGKKLSATVTDGERLSWSLSAGSTNILEASPLGISADGTDLGANVKLGQAKIRKISQSYKIQGNHAFAKNVALQADIPVSCGSKTFTLQLRLEDEGAAVRYVIPAGVSKISGEATGWTLAGDPASAAWQDFQPSYEGFDHVAPWEKVPQKMNIAGFITLNLSSLYLFISEANNRNFPDFALQREGRTLRPVWYADAQFSVDPKKPVTSPWRTISVTKDLTALVNSDLITNLADPQEPGFDFSFSKPGRILWQWCSIGAPKLEDQKDWYDAAAKLKWEYYMIDDGWRDWKKNGKGQWELLKEVIDYGKSKGVPTFIWVDSKEMRNAKSRRAYLEKAKASGAVGIKIDFIPQANADVMKWYDDTLRETARLKLMTIFHGCVKPTGLERTWPHALTREGVRGNEYQMTRYNRLAPKTQDVRQPFTRFLCGAGDITPMVLDPKELRGYSRAHMFAQCFTTLSPWACYYDQYKFYVESDARDLFSEMPVVWDETRVLDLTEIGKVVGFARRKGNTWWIGVVNGPEEKSVKIPMNFLVSRAEATILTDVKDPAKDDAWERSTKIVSPSDSMDFSLRPGGGCVMRIKAGR